MIDIKKILKSALWTFPFLFFSSGYYLTHYFFHKKEVETPNIIGKSIQESIKMISKAGLNIRLFREKVDSDREEGVVLEQIPRPYCMVKPTQHVFITTSKHPDGVVTPQLLGESYSTAMSHGKKLGVRPSVFWVESSYPKGLCFAQFPQQGEMLGKQQFTSYFSLGRSQLYLFPNLKNSSVDRVKRFLESEKIKIDLFHKNEIDSSHRCHNCVVVDQNPMAGAIVDRSKGFYVQLSVLEK